MEQLRAIGYPLPEDIEKLKWYGDFDGCQALILQRMAEDIPAVLREKLQMELAQIKRMRRDYTVTPEEAEAVLSRRLKDFQPGELEQLRRENVLDWIFVNGQVRYIHSFYENLIKIRNDMAARQKHPPCPEPGRRTETELRDQMIAGMKKHGGVTCTITLRASMDLDLTKEQLEKTARVWLPYPMEGAQIKRVTLDSASHVYISISGDEAHQRTVYFEGPGKELSHTEIVYTVENQMNYVNLNPAEVLEQQPNFYTGEQLPHIAFTPYLRALAAELTAGEENPLNRARRIYDFLTTKVNYSYMRSYLSLPVIPEYCASRLRGDCGVQALTFITLCRIAGIPARWQSGLYANENEAWCHDWAMFYIAPYGWLYADCSYGGAAWRDGAIDRWNFYFGNLDPYRVVTVREFQADFSPKPVFLRKDPYDNQDGEAELLTESLEHFGGKAEVLQCRVDFLKK